MSSTRGGPEALYRFFGEDGVLLYVGITNHLPGRMSEHAVEKPWWLEVQQVKVEHYPTRDDVSAAEQKAILEEHPRYNIQGRPFRLNRLTWPKLLEVEPSLCDLEQAARRYDHSVVDWWTAWALGDGWRPPFKRLMVARVGWLANSPCEKDDEQARRELGRNYDGSQFLQFIRDDELEERAQSIHRHQCDRWRPVHPLINTSRAYELALAYYTTLLARLYGNHHEHSGRCCAEDVWY